jgi:hypothetical protein
MVKTGLVFCTLLAATSCSSDSTKDGPTGTPADASTLDAGPSYGLSGTLTPSAETPPCTSAGSGAGGFAMVTISGDGKSIMAMVSYSSLSGAATAAHIHYGTTTAAGPDVLDFSSTASPITQTFTASDYKAPSGGPATFDAFVTALKTQANTAYVNVHTAACQDGEIRAELAHQ